jgi:hypothetical protein
MFSFSTPTLCATRCQHLRYFSVDIRVTPGASCTTRSVPDVTRERRISVLILHGQRARRSTARHCRSMYSDAPPPSRRRAREHVRERLHRRRYSRCPDGARVRGTRRIPISSADGPSTKNSRST